MNTWLNPHRVVSAEPLPRDHVVAIFVEGRRVSIHPAAQYERVLAHAQAFASEVGRPVKVLPMTIGELMGFMNMDAAELAASLSQEGAAQDRELVVTTCREILRNCDDGAVRREAYDLLISMGELSA